MANCFVIMPFRPALTYFYTSLKEHVESTFGDVTVERGDDRVLTTTILEKIKEFLEQADVVIADVSGRNPNVFYELGMAHAMGKSVILLTGDEIEEAPTDIRAFEFISYAKYSPEIFLAKLSDALSRVVGKPYADLYPEARDLFEQFRVATAVDAAPGGEADFEASMSAMYVSRQRLPESSQSARAEYLVRRLLGVEPEIDVLVALRSWSKDNFD